MNNEDRVIDEFKFTHLVELGKIAVKKGNISEDIVEKALIRIAIENEILIELISL